MAEITVEATEVPAQLPKVRVAVLGAGKMGGILLQAFLKQNLFAAEQIHATVGHAERAVALSTQWGVDVSTNNLEAAKQSDLILLGVKPFQVPGLIDEIRPALTKDKMLLSFAASVKTRAIEEAAGWRSPSSAPCPIRLRHWAREPPLCAAGDLFPQSRWSWPSASLRPWAARSPWTRSIWTP